MAFKHGVYTSEIPTAILPARSVDSNAVFVVGTAAVHRLDPGKPRYVNQLRMYLSYADYVEEMGWDDEGFNRYSLQELIYSHFALYRGAPVIVCNVFDPEVHKTSVSGESVTFSGDVATLQHGGVARLELTSMEGTTYVEGTDYSLNVATGGLTRLADGSISESATLTARYDYADVSLVDSADVIGGINAMTGDSEGLELIDAVFPTFGVVPGSILAPRFGEDPAVAAIMAAKADGINGLFKAIAIVDIPSDGENGVRKYTDVADYKKRNNLSDELLICCWPKVKLGDRVFGLATQLTGLMSQVDYDNGGVPFASASNKKLETTSIGMVAEDGGWKEISLGLDKCNALNGEGVYTAVSWDGVMRSWGGRTSVYPSTTDPKDCQESIRRFFNWWQNTFILTYFQKVDAPLTKRLIQTILKSEQIRLDGYAAREMILGGTITFDGADNPTTDLIDGVLRFHTRITPPPAGRDIESSFEFDTDNLSVLFSA